METEALRIDSSAVLIDGNKVTLPAWKSAHLLSGASNWWDRAGVVGGYFTNLDPDTGAAQQPNNPGGRACLYQETGLPNVSIECDWHGIHGAGCFPVVCIDETNAAFGIGFWREIFLGQWRVWELGKQPDDITGLQTDTLIDVSGGELASDTGVTTFTMAAHGLAVDEILSIDTEHMAITATPTADTVTVSRGYAGTTAATHTDGTSIFTQAYRLQGAPHVDGVPVTIRMDVQGDQCTCYGDGVPILTCTIPAALVGSTKHGVSIDVGGGGAAANQQCGVAPYTITGL